MTLKDIEMTLYTEMCRACPNARKCHEECETCEEFEKRRDLWVLQKAKKKRVS